MKVLLVLALAATCILASPGPRVKRQGLASLTVDIALRDRLFMRRQLNCLLSEGNCDNIGRDLKRIAPELLRGQCPGCNQKQVDQARKVMTFVSQNYPREWRRLLGAYAG